MQPWRHARSRLALAVQAGEPTERITELRREYRAARAAQYLHDLLSSDFPPTGAQRAELASLLVGGGEADAAAA
jgi:hypothetical protein